MNTFTPHPSVRVKGAETSFNVSPCSDPKCLIKNPHMHCPFCVKTESYQDPVILKMHYRVKHVDKGVDFAGLKILRCCDRCELVGAIKDEKIFKGAHWHCYRCRNGFNRRDEAIKHYKTHFRNPETTFQIQISQIEDGEGLHELPSVDEPDQTANGENKGPSSSTNKPGQGVVSVAANETVGSTEPQTIMIIQEDDLDVNNSATMENTFTVIPNTDYSESPEEIECVLGNVQHEQQQQQAEPDLQPKLIRLQERIAVLEKENSELKKELSVTKRKLSVKTNELRKCEQDKVMLTEQINVPVNKNIEKLLSSMEKDYADLLRYQLSQIRQNYLSQLNKENHTITIPSDALQNAVLESETGSVCITIQRGGDATMDNLDQLQNTFEVERVTDAQQTESAQAMFSSNPAHISDASDNSVIEIIPVSQHQLHVGEEMEMHCDVSQNQSTPTVTLSSSVTSETFDASHLQPVVISSSAYPFPTNPVVETSCDLSRSDLKISEPPTKRMKTGSDIDIG